MCPLTLGRSWRRALVKSGPLGFGPIGGAVAAAVDDEVVALGLEPNGAVDRIRKQRIVVRCTQRFAQIGGILVAEAGVQRSRASDAHAIEGFAEIMSHRGDKAELAAGLGDADIARRPASA